MREQRIGDKGAANGGEILVVAIGAALAALALYPRFGVAERILELLR
jgi:hypothetical protein